jgi:hypothetical protein
VKRDFAEWYGPDPDEFRRIAREAQIVLDTNVLLSLYRVSAVQREEILDVLRKVSDRLWLPYQVGLEYQRNRLKVVHEQSRVYALLRQRFSQTSDGVRQILKDQRAHALLESAVVALIERLVTDFDEAIDDLEAQHVLTVEQALDDDPVRDALDDLFESKVGPTPDPEELKRLYRRVGAAD